IRRIRESEPRKVSFGVGQSVDNQRQDTTTESASRPMRYLLRAGYAVTRAAQAKREEEGRI
ncbi:hypothetical protein ACQ1Z3_15535, partial [Enterococcus faecalis]|uniref:hypothetical protein n=1 Tax=Enterococcus faecalis TaxID=1351 RepID=UPI003D6B789D